MCGVVAALGRPVGRSVLQLAHRGTTVTVSGQVGHVRLPIVGLGSVGDQPVVRGRWTMGFVGEILNFREISPGMECDTTLAVDAFLKLGPQSFRSFDGFWSFVAHDAGADELTFFVDYLAQKPLYYRIDAPSVASEPDALLGYAPVTPDPIYMAAVIKWGYCPNQARTPYRQIHKVLPGEMVKMDAAGRTTRSITDPLHPRRSEDLKREIEAAVRRRVESSDVPVAALVSGGLDSAITYTLAKRHGDVTAFHVENGEFEEALEVIGGLEPRSKYARLDQEPSVEKCLEYMQEPIDLGSLAPQVALSDAIGGKETVCLTGDGADELFGGYGRSMRYDSQASDVWHELVMWHLPRLDRVMMRNRTEVRSPFLSRRVVEAALALPWKGVRQDKRYLRWLFRDDLPAGVADRPKKALRTKGVEQDREARSTALVDAFKEKHGW